MSIYLEHCDWKYASDVSFGSTNEIHVWKIPLLQVNEHDFKYLSPDEKQRLSNYRNEQSRTVFYSTRITMRKLFARYLHIVPEAVSFATSKQGKPYLDNSMAKLEFNLTHSREQILLAVSSQQTVGIDIEEIKVIANWQRIAKKVFDKSLIKHLQYAANPADEFVKLWTEFEARQKLAGVGVFGSQPQTPEKVTTINFKPAPDYHAALAFQTAEPLPCIVFYQCDSRILRESAIQ